MLTLYIGNKNYSSWSMRPWVMLKQADIAFEEVMVRFDSFSGDSQFKKRLGPISPGKEADPIVVRTSDLNLAPVSDPVGAIALAAHPGNVEHVLVRGEFRKRNGPLAGIDLDAVRARARKSRERILDQRRTLHA